MNDDVVEKLREKLDSLTISDYHGLNSPGLTCYLNSVLQVLFMTEDFREAVKGCSSEDSTIIDPHLGRLFSDLQTTVAKTHNITEKLGIVNVYEQRDAAEYFEKILCLTSPEAAKMFKGELNHKTTCHKCKEKNNSRSFFWTLPLTVEDLRRQTYSVEKGLKAFFKGEKVCGDNKMYCNSCDEKRNADFAMRHLLSLVNDNLRDSSLQTENDKTAAGMIMCGTRPFSCTEDCGYARLLIYTPVIDKGIEITQNPEILTLLLKRFTFDYKRRCYVKLHCKVDVPQMLHMKNCTYDLYALVNHFGSLTGGHYTAQIKSFETQAWYHFNDDIVEGVKQPLFGAGDKYLRSCTAYLLMYRKVSRNPERTDAGDQEALCARSDDEAERKEAPVLHHQLRNESYNGGENLMHVNGDLSKKSHDDSVFKKKLPNPSGKLENQRTASVRPHKEVLPQTDTGEDGDGHKPSLRTQTPNSAKLQQAMQQTERDNSGIQTQRSTCGLSTLEGAPQLKTDLILEQNPESPKKRLKMTGIDWETQDNNVTKTAPKTTSGRRNRVKPAGTEVVENTIEAEVTNVRTEGMNKRVNSSSSVQHLTEHSQSQIRRNEPPDCNYPLNLYRKSNSSKRDEEKMQRVVTQTVTKGEKTTSPTKKRKSEEVERKPWR